MTDYTKQPWTPGPISDEYIRAAFRHVTKQTDLDGLGLEHLKDAIGDGSINIPTCYGGDPKLYATAPVLAKALAAVVHRYDTATTSAAFVARKDTPEIAAARAALDLCGWNWGGR